MVMIYQAFTKNAINIYYTSFYNFTKNYEEKVSFTNKLIIFALRNIEIQCITKKITAKMQKTFLFPFEVLNFAEIEQKFQQLIELAKQQTEKSYAPYSKFNVGAVVLLENGEVVGGNNQENAAYPSSLCAERVAMFYANAQHPDIKPIAIAIAAKNEDGFLKTPISPCGGCRQVLLEAELRYGEKIRIFLYGTEKTYLINSVQDLLPFAFSQEQL